MSQLTFINDAVRTTIAVIVGDRFDELETFLVSNHLRLQHVPPPPQPHGGTYQGDDQIDWNDFLQQAVALQSPEAEGDGQDPIPNLLTQETPDEDLEMPTFDPNEGIDWPPLFEIPIDYPAEEPNDDSHENPEPNDDGEAVLRPRPDNTPEGSQITITAPVAESWTARLMDPVASTRLARERWYQQRMEFFANAWATGAEDAVMMPHVFSFHDWMLRLPNEPLRGRYIMAYMNAAAPHGVVPRFNRVTLRTPQNFQILVDLLFNLMVEDRNRESRNAPTIPNVLPPTNPRHPPPPPPPPVSSTGNSDSDNDNDDDDEDDNPPRLRRGRKIQATGTAAELEKKRKARIAKRKSRRLKKEEEQRIAAQGGQPGPNTQAIGPPRQIIQQLPLPAAVPNRTRRNLRPRGGGNVQGQGAPQN